MLTKLGDLIHQRGEGGEELGVVEVEAERAAQEPRVFTRIHLHFIISGDAVDAKHVERRPAETGGVDLSIDRSSFVARMYP